MCRWLKLTNLENPEVGCILYEHPLSACGYVSAEFRHDPTPLDSLDCTVRAVRASVVEAEVPSQVDALEICMDGVAPGAAQACAMALDFLRSEISDYRNETAARETAGKLSEQFEEARLAGEEALASKHHVNHAVEVLDELLTQANALPGNFLEQEMAEARELADRLSPISTVRAELHRAIDDGRHAARTERPFAVEEAIVWLKAALAKAQRYDVGPPVPTAESMLGHLQTLHRALVALEDATLAGNVSLAAKSDMPDAIQRLTAAVRVAGPLNVSVGEATHLLGSLEALEDVVEALEGTTAVGQRILTTAGLKGWDEMSQAAADLNRTIADALVVGLENDGSTLDATAARERLMYIIGSRESLHSAVEHGVSVLDQDRAELSDNEEEDAEQRLAPAIAWGEDVGLVKGLGVAREVLQSLVELEEVKEQMVGALALGNASLEARTGEDRAIAALAEAIASSQGLNATGGIPEAKRELRLLATRKVARGALEMAASMATDALENHSGEKRAAVALNASVAEGLEAGLVNESRIARLQLQRLEAFLQSQIDLHAALNVTTPKPGKLPKVVVNDTRPESTFRKNGFRVVDLPEVEHGDDDGDDDFDEHLDPLRKAIESGRAEGEVDPELEAQFSRERAKRDAYELMQKAIARGNASFNAKDDIDGAILDLTTALQEAGEEHLQLGVPDIRVLLADLNTIRPAREELSAAVLEANVSRATVSGMDSALVRLSNAIAMCEKLHLPLQIPEALEVRDALSAVRSAFISIKAAIVQGQLSLRDEEGEEAAVRELNEAIQAADAMGMHKKVPVAVDLLHELAHMNAQHQQMQAAMSPAL